MPAVIMIRHLQIIFIHLHNSTTYRTLSILLPTTNEFNRINNNKIYVPSESTKAQTAS